VPEWYMLPFYAILRAIPDKLMGVIAMFAAIAVIFAVPWLDTSKVRSMRYRPVMRWFFVIFVVTCCLLGWCGGQLPEDYVFALGSTAHGAQPIGLKVVLLSQILTAYYFAFFLIIMPWIGLKEEPLPQPASISQAVLREHSNHQ
jgi:quinol-cytochrome oxidoreductase complex cytochrome b subunit